MKPSIFILFLLLLFGFNNAKSWSIDSTTNDSIIFSKIYSIGLNKFIGKKFSLVLQNDTLIKFQEYSYDGSCDPDLNRVVLWYSDNVTLTIYFNQINYQNSKAPQKDWNFELLKNEVVSRIKLSNGFYKKEKIFSQLDTAKNLNELKSFSLVMAINEEKSINLKNYFIDTNVVYISSIIMYDSLKGKPDTIYFYNLYFADGSLFVSHGYSKFPNKRDLNDRIYGNFGTYKIKRNKIQRTFVHSFDGEEEKLVNLGRLEPCRIVYTHRKPKGYLRRKIPFVKDEKLIKYFIIRY